MYGYLFRQLLVTVNVFVKLYSFYTSITYVGTYFLFGRDIEYSHFLDIGKQSISCMPIVNESYC